MTIEDAIHQSGGAAIRRRNWTFWLHFVWLPHDAYLFVEGEYNAFPLSYNDLLADDWEIKF
jgi:hypothetical protein